MRLKIIGLVMSVWPFQTSGLDVIASVVVLLVRKEYMHQIRTPGQSSASGPCSSK